MPLTDRFIKLPTKIYNEEEHNLTGNKRTEETIIHINPLDISVYFDAFTKDGERYLQIETKGGGIYSVDVTLDEFEKILNAHS